MNRPVIIEQGGKKYTVIKALVERPGRSVLLVQDSSGQEKVLECLLPRKDPSFMKELEQEFSLLRPLAHPHIAFPFDWIFDEKGGHCYIATDYLPGKNLAEALEGADGKQALNWFAECLKALDYLHRQGMYHRHLKPENIRVSEEGEIKLIGLGAGRPEEESGEDQVYCPPELLADPGGPPSPQGELYSLGVCFYRGLTGELPFSGTTRDELLREHHLQSPTAPSHVRPNLDKHWDGLLLGTLQEIPSHRYSSASALLQQVNLILGSKKGPFSPEEIEFRFNQHGLPIGKESVIDKAVRFLEAWKAAPAPEGEIWLVESEAGLGATYLLQELKILSQLKGMRPFLWNQYLSHFPTGEGYVWLVDDLSKMTGEEAQEKLTAFSSKLKEMIHRGESKKGWIVLGGLHKFSQLPEDLQRILNQRSKRFRLNAWSANEIEKRLNEIFQVDQIPDFLIRVLQKESGGNPQKILQLLRTYLKRKLLIDRGGHWRKDLFHPNRLFAEEFGEGRPAEEFEALFKRLGPEEKRLLFFLANLYEAAPQAFIERWMRSQFIYQHLHRLKSLGILAGGGEEPYQIAVTGLKGFLLDQMGTEAIEALNDQLLDASKRADFEPYFSAESRFFHQAHGSDPSLSAEGWAFFGDWAARRGLSQSAYEYYTRAHDRLPKEKTERRFELAVDRGKCLISANRLSEAKSFFESLLKSYAEHRETKPEFFSKIHERLGLIEMKRGRLKKARERFGEALRLLEKAKDPLVQSLGVENFLASLDLLEGNYSRAIEGFRVTYERAVKELPWERRRVLTNNDLGEALLQNGQEQEAIAHWEVCLEDFKKREDQNPLVRCYYQLSLAYQKIGDEERGYRYLLESLGALRSLQNPEMELRIYNALANSRKGKDPEKALECYEKALECAFQIQDAYSTGVILLNMGFLEAEQGHWEKVKHCLSQGMAYLEGSQGMGGQLPLLLHSGEIGMSRACLALHQPHEALVHAKKAMALVEKNSDIAFEKFDTLLVLREALELSGKHSEAERCARVLEKIAQSPEEKEKLKATS